MARTKIEWCARPGTIPESWSPVTGCTPISEGCKHCYAARMARRLAGRYGYPEAPHHFDVTLHLDKLNEPLRRKKPRTYFVCSMSDLFHEDVKTDWIAHIWGVMIKAEQHTFQVLTKRPQRMLEWVRNEVILTFPNIWLGVSVEDQAMADERIPLLLQTPAAVRFVSCEPLLSSIDLSEWVNPQGATARDDPAMYSLLNWVIVGGESGPGARPMYPQWARETRDQCQAAGVPFFFKQNGAFIEVTEGFRSSDTVLMHDGRILGRYSIWDDRVAEKGYTVVRPVGKKRAGHLLDGREWREFPADREGG